jgi:prepilin-type N-terminal cleavage/methylation domain-containing protein
MKRGQKGFSLAELLVAIAVTLIVLAATLAAFSEAVQVNDFATLMADMDQNLRAAVNMMVRDLSQTGTGIPTGGLPCPSGTGVQPINRPSPPGTAYTFPTDPLQPLVTTLHAINPGDGLGPTINNVAATDMVTVLYADSTLPLNTMPLSAIAPDGSTMTVDPSIPVAAGLNTDLQPGDLIMFSNALGNAIQTITRTTGTQTVRFDNNDFFGFNQRTVPGGTIMCLQNPGTNTNPNDCSANNGGWPPTTATRIWMITYYLDATTDPNLPRLIRQINNFPGRPVALVLENLQLSYDIVDGVTNPTNQATVPNAFFPNTNPNQVRKVNLFLAARSSQPTPRNQQFLRNSVSTQISLRSLSFVSRY